MNLKTSRNSSADSHVHLEVSNDFCKHSISTIIPIHDHQFHWSSILPNRMSFETSSSLWNYRNKYFTSQQPLTVYPNSWTFSASRKNQSDSNGECALDNTKKHSLPQELWHLPLAYRHAYATCNMRLSTSYYQTSSQTNWAFSILFRTSGFRRIYQLRLLLYYLATKNNFTNKCLDIRLFILKAMWKEMLRYKGVIF